LTHAHVIVKNEKLDWIKAKNEVFCNTAVIPENRRFCTHKKTVIS